MQAQPAQLVVQSQYGVPNSQTTGALPGSHMVQNTYTSTATLAPPTEPSPAWTGGYVAPQQPMQQGYHTAQPIQQRYSIAQSPVQQQQSYGIGPSPMPQQSYPVAQSPMMQQAQVAQPGYGHPQMNNMGQPLPQYQQQQQQQPVQQDPGQAPEMKYAPATEEEIAAHNKAIKQQKRSEQKQKAAEGCGICCRETVVALGWTLRAVACTLTCIGRTLRH